MMMNTESVLHKYDGNVVVIIIIDTLNIKQEEEKAEKEENEVYVSFFSLSRKA
jgi:hypothetical protein